MNDLPISKILAKYDTDKVNGHTYGESYDRFFSKFDRNAPLDILEVGTQKGGSLLAWQEYFPNAKVTGVDIVDVVKPEYRSEKIRYIVSDIKKWNTDEAFDIVIDDGSHTLSDVLWVMDHIKLKPGGLLVIEDVQDPAWSKSIHRQHTMDVLGKTYDNTLLTIWNP